MLIARKPILNGYSVMNIQYLQNKAQIEIQEVKKFMLDTSNNYLRFPHILLHRATSHVITTLPYTSTGYKARNFTKAPPHASESDYCTHTTHTNCYSKVVLRYILHQIPLQPTWFTKKTLNKCPQKNLYCIHQTSHNVLQNKDTWNVVYLFTLISCT